ncbi:MAG: UDP-N-acetylglucosamine 1-carboxyvinyltransferase [Armatimonadetes bacterium]|nr:UDP-N-acetylglucosamine 1-carboxyvinyltransferase [Armatimonadota bacterium]MDE2206755.1 UDP-N-acetylglucosamine 1-carboxyvinyltransferase [Armatimonadota bacterium]
MDKIIIRGGRPLTGTIDVGGSKNDSVPIMAAALLVPGVTVLQNVPRITDVYTFLEILGKLGAMWRFRDDGALEIDATNLNTYVAPHELVRRMRASFCLLGVLLARFRQANVAMPGGCDIGARPVNYHVKGLEQLGCNLQLEHGIYVGEVERFVGATIHLDGPSAGATQHLMIAAATALGVTVLENCAAEPEIVNLAAFLNACGAQIEGAGTPVIRIHGVDELKPCTFAILPDRLQACTYMLAAAITDGDVTIRNANLDHCRPVIAKLKECGIEVRPSPHGIRVRRSGVRILPTDITTMPHPGFPTDMQQPFCAMLAMADGVSLITETVYDGRFRYTTELERMGADIRVQGRTAKITGVPRLTGAPVTCTDLRAGAALVVAALAAEGETEVSGLEHLDRGYEDFSLKLMGLGAEIHRATGTSDPGDLRLCSA